MIPILTSCNDHSVSIPEVCCLRFFGIPGLGRMSFNAINSSDFDVIKAVVFIGA